MDDILDKSWVVYGLRLVDEQEYRYIGITSGRFRFRLNGHRTAAFGKNSHLAVHCWMRKHGRASVVADIIEECPFDDLKPLNDAEIHWIAYYRSQGHRLLNHTDGGGGASGAVMTEDHKEKIRAGTVKHFDTNGHKSVREFWVEHYGEDRAEVLWSELREKRSVQMSGTGNNMYGKTGPDAPCYGRIGDKHPMFGTHHSEEAKRKISAATKGRPKSATTKVKMSLANHKRFHSEKMKNACRWCLGADLQTEIEKVLLNEQNVG